MERAVLTSAGALYAVTSTGGFERVGRQKLWSLVVPCARNLSLPVGLEA
jgi:hypothetical protein